jgi:hypothetical protein
LAHGRLRAKALVFEGWKSLDFLGFSRPNLDLSMGYAGFSLKEISRALLPSAVAAPERAPAFLEFEKRRIVHGDKLTLTSDFLQ